MAPEWLPQRSHDSGRQSNAAVDIGLKVARVGDDGTQVGELVNKFDIIVAVYVVMVEMEHRQIS